jgi:hypothetical protein
MPTWSFKETETTMTMHRKSVAGATAVPGISKPAGASSVPDGDGSSIPARLAAIKSASTPELKAQWRALFDSEPPPFNRRYLESRLAYRVQELTFGGLKPETVKRLEALGEQLDGGTITTRRIRADRDRPITGTRLLREWQGVEQIVTVTADGFEWQGRPYKSLSAIARAITGTRWNGWVFFGLKNHRRRA